MVDRSGSIEEDGSKWRIRVASEVISMDRDRTDQRGRVLWKSEWYV